MNSEAITSAQNRRIKEIISLHDKSRSRREKSLFIAEGVREIRAAVAGGYTVKSLYYVPEFLDKHPEFSSASLPEIPAEEYIRLSQEVYSRVAYRESTEGVLAVVRSSYISLEDEVPGENPLVIVLEGVEKPGNLGAVLRTADACGADYVVFADCPADLYNPNLIRSSLGTVFTCRVICSDSESVYGWLKKYGISILTAQLQDSVPYYRTDMKRGTAIVLGSESGGLTGFWRERSDARIRIPMLGHADSLNVSVSAAVLCYEAVRQRREGI